MMALRDIIMNDDDLIREDVLAEKMRELGNAYERIEDLERAIRGLLGMAQLLSKNPDIPEHIRELLATNHRVIDAKELLR